MNLARSLVGKDNREDNGKVLSTRPHWDFFIAHAGKDAAVAEALYDELYLNARTFLDSRSLMLGDDWDHALQRAQLNSRITVVLISENTDQAYYQREEIASAIAMARKDENGHRVVPVYLNDGIGEIPYGLRLKHSVRTSEVGGVGGAAAKLLEVLDRMKSLGQSQSGIGELSERQADALFILQHTPVALPATVLHEAARIDQNEIAKLSFFITAGSAKGETRYSLTQAPMPALKPRNADDLIARTLEELVGYIGQHKKDGIDASHVDAALALAKRCKEIRPRASRKLFDAIDGILKRRGAKNKVYEAANLSIEATKHALRDDEDVQIEARALICGRSWVLQRVGHLDEALAEALKSLELGEKIRWERNTAFCKKCLGRLYRMLGMRATDIDERNSFFQRSIDSLKQAIAIFSRMEKFGPDCAEVGDCYSLMARTLLIAKQYKNTRMYLRKAAERLTNEDDKDYLDYRLLEADYANEMGDADGAEHHYQFVIDATDSGDSEKSEIRSRAFHQRGSCRAKRNMRAGALADYSSAAELWDGLKERKRAAEARWEMILLDGKLSSNSISCLNRTCATTRVIAVLMHERRMALLCSGNSRRADPERKYWDQLIKDASEQDAKQDIWW